MILYKKGLSAHDILLLDSSAGQYHGRLARKGSQIACVFFLLDNAQTFD